MKTTSDKMSSQEQKPRNKANMDQPQEEFIDSQPSHFEHDIEHGDELQFASHSDRWKWAVSEDWCVRPGPD